MRFDPTLTRAGVPFERHTEHGCAEYGYARYERDADDQWRWTESQITAVE